MADETCPYPGLAELEAALAAEVAGQERTDEKGAPPRLKSTRPWPYDGPEGRARLTGNTG